MHEGTVLLTSGYYIVLSEAYFRPLAGLLSHLREYMLCFLANQGESQGVSPVPRVAPGWDFFRCNLRGSVSL